MILAAACASIAGLEEPDDDASKIDATTPPASGTSTGGAADGAPSSSSGSPPADAAGDVVEAASDAPPGSCQPPKKPNGATCAAPADCCSNACNEAATCVDDCRTNDFCDPFGDDCCAGTFCPRSIPFRCATCKKAGEAPRDNLAKSCCSRTIGGDNKCL